MRKKNKEIDYCRRIKLDVNGKRYRNIERPIPVTLNDIQQQQECNKEAVDLSQVYKRIELELEGSSYYILPEAMQPIHQNYLQPQGLIEVVNCNKVRITDKGRRRCEQITRTNQALWQETVRRLNISTFAISYNKF